MSDTLLLRGNPGCVDKADRPYGLSAEVALELLYHNAGEWPGATKAILHLLADKIDDGVASMDIGIELNRGDLVDLGNTINALLQGLNEDEDV